MVDDPEREVPNPDAHGRIRLAPGETVKVFRAVVVGSRDDPRLVESFRSDAELGGDRLGRDEVEYAALSTREQHDQVRDLIRNVARSEDLPPDSPDLLMGNYVARVVLTDELDALYRRDPPPQGHVSIWGDAAQLAAAVAEIHSAWE